MNSPNIIKTILYDLDGTLRFNRPSGRTFFLDYLATFGLDFASEDRRRMGVWEHRYWAESADMLQDQAEFTSPQTFWTNYACRQLEVLGCRPEQAHTLAPEIRQYMDENYHPEDALLPGADAMLQQLSAGGYVLGVVSNRDKPFGDYLVAKGLCDYVTFSLSGGEAGSKKPDRGIFEQALRISKSIAEETIYIGDNYFADVIGARAAGIQPVVFDPEGLFVQPGCPVIRSHDELSTLLNGRNLWPGNER